MITPSVQLSINRMLTPLTFAALDEVALEGSNGCEVRLLWDRLQQRLPIAGVAALDADVKNLLWILLLQRTEDVTISLGNQAIR